MRTLFRLHRVHALCRRALLALALNHALLGAAVQAQQWPPTLPPNTVIGRLNIGPGPAQAVPITALTGSLFSSMSGDCTMTIAGVITCTKSNGTAFGPFATQASPCTLAQGCLGGSQSAATAYQVPVFPGSGGAASPTTISTLLDTLFGSAQGDVLYRGSGGWAALAPGTSGDFLQTQGSAANPQWAPSGGSSCGVGIACMWPTSASQASGAWNVQDMWGNNLSSICSGTSTQCLQEFITYTAANGEPAEVRSPGTFTYEKETGTLTNGSNIVTGLSCTSNCSTPMTVGDYVITYSSGASYTNYFPSFTQITSIDSTSQIHVSNNATGSGSSTQTLWFSNVFVNITATSGVKFPPVENWYFHAINVNLTFAPAYNGPGIQFDSVMASQIMWDGVIVYQPSSHAANSYALSWAPANPVPEDGIIVDTASYFRFTNPVGESNAVCIVCFNGGNSQTGANGGIVNNTFDFVEINGESTYGIYLFNAVGSIEQNIIKAPNLHGGTTAAIQVGDGTHTSNISGNQFYVTEHPRATGAYCIETYGQEDIYVGQCDNSEAGGSLTDAFLFRSSASLEQFMFTVNGDTSLNVSGSAAWGIINSAYYAAGNSGCSGSSVSTVTDGIVTAC
jgi:hypothetical protein